MSRRKKRFEERRQELSSSITILSAVIREFESTGDVSFLRAVAAQLRALVVHEPRSGNLKHPLLMELAYEADFPLTVFTTDPWLTDITLRTFASHQLECFTTGDSMSLIKGPPYTVETMLSEALEQLHIMVGRESLSLKQVIRLVADTESVHYDPERPQVLDELSTVNIGGLTPEYRTIYTTGKIVCDLGYRLIRDTT